MTDYQENFIQKMRFYRKRTGLTQAQLAELCSVSNGTIGNIECGITKPSFDLIIKIADSIKVQPAELFKTELVPQNRDSRFSSAQFEIVSAAFHSAMNEAVDKAMTDIKFKIDHS